MKPKKNILVAPLNWGLGHATRCIPIINELINNDYNPIIASDGNSLELLKKEFPDLTHLELPSYEIEYAKKGENLKWKLIKNSPKTLNAILEEKKIVKEWVKIYNLKGIISDNRLGVRSKKVTSIFITHQLTVLSGTTTWISSKMHQHFIKKFDECWIPDFEEKPNLSGKLGHLKNTKLNLKYIGALSRFSKHNFPKKYDLMILLSGPEPQRTLFEEKILEEIKKYDKKIIFVKGVVEKVQTKEEIGNVTFCNFMTSTELEQAINESEKIICRSGYTTVMDLAKLAKKAFFVPTPGQFEQEYLGKRFERKGILPYCKQDDFKLEKLSEIDLYEGLSIPEKELNWKQLFMLFQV